MSDSLTGTDAQALAQGDVTGTPTPTPVAQPAVGQGSGSGPWATALAQFDEAVRPQVDAFIRTNVQPYVTQLEQAKAGAADAVRLYESFAEAPAETYLHVTEQLFGAEAVDQVIALIAGDPVDDGETDLDTTPVQPQRDPEVEAMLNDWQATKQKNAYDGELARVKREHEGDTPVIDALFHPFVSAADGDFDAAYEGYKQYYAQFSQQVGGQQVAASPPPPVSGSDSGSPSVPPTQPTHQSLDDALDALMDDLRTPPPVMGGV